MINREQFINEIAEVVNRNSMEKAFNDTPDFILAALRLKQWKCSHVQAHTGTISTNLERRTTGNIKRFAKAKRKQNP